MSQGVEGERGASIPEAAVTQRVRERVIDYGRLEVNGEDKLSQVERDAAKLALLREAPIVFLFNDEWHTITTEDARRIYEPHNLDQILGDLKQRRLSMPIGGTHRAVEEMRGLITAELMFAEALYGDEFCRNHIRHYLGTLI